MIRILLVLTLVLSLIVTAAADNHTAMDRATADAEAIENTVNAYHEALKNRDSAAAVALLSEQVIVLESGYIENHEEYLGHHLGADMEFSSGVPGKRTVKHVEVNGNAGWVIATSTAKGTFRERDINSAGVELIVVTRTSRDAPWKIKAIHWSSRKVKE